jgi:hypothetical protein
VVSKLQTPQDQSSKALDVHQHLDAPASLKQLQKLQVFNPIMILEDLFSNLNKF